MGLPLEVAWVIKELAARVDYLAGCCRGEGVGWLRRARGLPLAPTRAAARLEARPRSALILVGRSGLTLACAQIIYMGKVEASRDACNAQFEALSSLGDHGLLRRWTQREGSVQPSRRSDAREGRATARSRRTATGCTKKPEP